MSSWIDFVGLFSDREIDVTGTIATVAAVQGTNWFGFYSLKLV